MMTCRTFTPTLTSIKNYWKKLPDSSYCKEVRPAARTRAAFFIIWDTVDALVAELVAEVFNSFVEKSVEKRQSIDISGSLTVALAFCTGASAGTFWVEPTAQI